MVIHKEIWCRDSAFSLSSRWWRKVGRREGGREEGRKEGRKKGSKVHLLLPIAPHCTPSLPITAWTNHAPPHTQPPPPSVEKLSSMKPVPGAKKAGDHCSKPLKTLLYCPSWASHMLRTIRWYLIFRCWKKTMFLTKFQRIGLLSIVPYMGRITQRLRKESWVHTWSATY